jgi:hypothetical protein
MLWHGHLLLQRGLLLWRGLLLQVLRGALQV